MFFRTTWVCPLLLWATLPSFAQTTFSNPSPITIQSAYALPLPGDPYPAPINVSGLIGTVLKVQVTLHGIKHMNPDDLDILLVSPGGANAVLVSDVGGAQDVSGVTLTLDDAAASYLPDGPKLQSGTFRPTNMNSGTDTWPSVAASGQSALSAFNGTDPNGTWNLYVVDDGGNDAEAAVAGGWDLTLLSSLALPLVLSDFSARYSEASRSVVLNWSTPDIASCTFTVESSADGNQWEAIARILPATGTAYQCTDKNPPEGIAYYRIQWTTTDGVAAYSKILSVRVPGSEQSFRVYPVPAGSYLYIADQNGPGKRVAVCFTDLNGNNVLKEQGIIDSDQGYRVDLSRLRRGVYWLRITSQNAVQVRQILVSS